MADVPTKEGAEALPRGATIPDASSSSGRAVALLALEKPDDEGEGGSRIGTKAFDVVMMRDPKTASGESSSSDHAGDGVKIDGQEIDAGGDYRMSADGGGGGRMSSNGSSAKQRSGDDMDIDEDKAKERTATTSTPNGPSEATTRGGPAWDDFDPEECFICFDGGEIILCDYCNRSYHLECHRPPLKEVPEGKFRCMECVAVSNWGVSSAPTAGGVASDKGKKRAQNDAPNSVDPSEAKKYIGTRIAKLFDGEVYFGSITQYNEKTQFWHVVYDDDDEEDYDPRDLEEAGKLYRKERKHDDPNKSRGAQQRYFRRDKLEKAPAPPKQKKKKVEKPRPERSNAKPASKKKQGSTASPPSARPTSRSQSPVAQKLPPKYCVIQVPKEARPGDIIDVVFPGDEFTSQIVCPEFVQRSPFVTVVAPGGYRPPSAPIDYARANADRLCDGLPTNNTRPFVVEAFNCTLWPALKADGWKRVDILETGTGSTQFIPPGNRYSLSDSAGRLGLGYCTSYQGVISFCASTEEYKELHAAFEIDIVARKQTAERLEQIARDMHYLSSKQHDTPIGPNHQVSNLPPIRGREQYLYETREHLRRERSRISWGPKFVNIATNDFLKNLSTQNRAEYDLEAAMEIFFSFDYNDIAARAVITMPVPPDESWRIGVNEKEFEGKLKASNHDLKKVADALGLNLIKCLWYYYHCYRPCRQWDFERDIEAFHDALLKARGDLRKAAIILGKRYDSCLWFYDSKYRFSPLHKEYKAVEERLSESCAICEVSGGNNLLLCSECPKSYHASCLSLEENDGVEEEWICPACNPGFFCPNCSKKFRKEGGLKNHLRRCDAAAMTDSDNSRIDQEEDDDNSAPENSDAQEDESVPLHPPPMSSLTDSSTFEQKRTAGVSTPIALNSSTRTPGRLPGRFPVPPVRNSAIPGTNNPKEIEAIDPVTMARLRLFPSVSDAARMSKINRTTLAKVCKEGGGIIEGIFYRFTSDGAKTKESNQSDPRKVKIRFRPDDSDNVSGEALISQKEREWASMDAKINAAQAGRPLAFIEEQKRLKEQQVETNHVSTRIEDNSPGAEASIALEISPPSPATMGAAVAAAAAAAAPTVSTEISDAGTSTPLNDVGLGDPSDEVDGLI